MQVMHMHVRVCEREREAGLSPRERCCGTHPANTPRDGRAFVEWWTSEQQQQPNDAVGRDGGIDPKKEEEERRAGPDSIRERDGGCGAHPERERELTMDRRITLEAQGHSLQTSLRGQF